jgi:hypothetical protein
MKRPLHQSREAAETLAIQALNFLAGDPRELARFLDLSGIEPSGIRAAAAQPEFLAGVLAHLGAHEPLLVAFAEAAGVAPGEVERARATLVGRDSSDPDRQRDTP